MTIDNAQIRHRNFMTTFQRFKDANPDLPERGMLKMFAERIGFSDRYLSHIKCNRKNIGSNVARSIETALALPHGWMDREHGPSDPAGSKPVNDAAEQLFLETDRSLYRADPEAAQRALLALLQSRLLGPSA